MTDTNFNGYGTDDAYGSSGYNSPGYQASGYEAPGYQSPGYVNGTAFGSTDAIGDQQSGYAPPDTWASGYQENVYDRANLLDTPYLDTAANPNPIARSAFDPYGASTNSYNSDHHEYASPQPLPKTKQQKKAQSPSNISLYRSSTFELEL